MTTVFRRIALILFVIIFSQACSSASDSAILLVSKPSATLYQLDRDKLIRPIPIQPNSLLAGITQKTISTTEHPRTVWYVRTVSSVSGESHEGWIGTESLQLFQRYTAQNQAIAASPNSPASSSERPELIQLTKNPSLWSAWDEAKLSIEENSHLPAPLPEPYFARAEIWAAVNNHDAALRDYLTATKIARKNGQDLSTYSAYFNRLHEMLEKIERIPASPALGTDMSYERLGNQHYISGFHAYWKGDLKESLDRFDSAIQLAPMEPIHWYYRALVFKSSGDETRAVHDALVGASMERRKREYERRGINENLSRIQGPTRTWLEKYRLGDPTQRILGQ